MSGCASSEPYRLFISYARDDAPYLARLTTHLAPFVRSGRIEVWSDGGIPPGRNWDAVVREEIRTCHAVVFLVSADLIASTYINDVEMKIARERLARGEVDVLAIPILHSSIEETWLKELQPLFNPETPIAALPSHAAQEAAWVAVVKKLLEAADLAAGARQRVVASPSMTWSGASPIRFRRSAHAPLLSRGGFFGREPELADLDGWLAGRGAFGDSRLVVLRALGGMGKSALAWQWSQIHAPQVAPGHGFEGVFWWSFYAPGFHIRAFARAALAFMGMSEDDVPKGLGPRLTRLAELSEERPAIFVLDGFERELRRFARRDAPDDVDAAAAQAGASQPDDCVDPETDSFLGRIAVMPSPSRWLMTTRIMPAMLVDLDGTRDVPLGGLSRAATHALFREQGVQGSEAALAEVEKHFGGHGLTLSVYARSLRRDGVFDLDRAARDAGDFRSFWRGVTGRKPAVTALEAEADRRLRVLMSAVDALTPAARDVLESFIYGETPRSMKMLEELNSHLPGDAIPRALAELRAAGLLAPSDNAFVYELHPVVRDVVDRTSKGIGLQRAIDTFEKLGGDRQYATLREAQRTIDLYLALVKAGRYAAAHQVYTSRLDGLFYAEGAPARRLDLIRRLCDGNLSPLVNDADAKVSILDLLASALSQLGRHTDAAEVAGRMQSIEMRTGDGSRRVRIQYRAANTLRRVGRLAAAARAVADEPSGTTESLWRFSLEIERAMIRSLRGERGEFESIGREMIPRARELEAGRGRDITLHKICLLAWQLRSFVLLHEAATIYRNESGMPAFSDVLADLHLLKSRLLGSDKGDASSGASLSALTRELQVRFASLDLFEFVVEAAKVAAMAQAWTGATAARRAAKELREIAEREERNGGIIPAADTRLETAEAWILAGDGEAARADALHARRLAWCDGPPYTAKLFEERADALIARL